MRWGFHDTRQLGLYSRVSAEVWNDLISHHAARRRDELADACVRLRVRPNLDTLRFYVHVPNPKSSDPYDHIGSVGWKVDVRGKA